MKVLKICIGTWENASHDKRELSVCRELGADVEVLAKGDEHHLAGMVDGFYVSRLSARPLKGAPVWLNRIFSLFAWARYVRKRKDVDILSCHDLPALLIGYLSNYFKRKKARLVYDSHEFELGKSKKRNVAQNLCIYLTEGFLIRKCDLTIMVSDSIADEVQRIHHLKKRSHVVRNIPSKWNVDFAKAEEIKQEFIKKLQMSKDTFVILYHGAVVQYRGIENLLEAAKKVQELAVVILGDGNENYIRKIKDQCISLGISGRVLFHSAVSLNELPAYVAAADIGVSVLMPVALSYVWALPNKFFENIQCLNPLIVSDFPEMGKIVDKYQIGLKINPEDPEEMASAINKLISDKELYAEYKKNLERAKEELCWEREKQKLMKAYQPLLSEA